MLTENVHISRIRIGDVIMFEGRARTVCEKDFGRDSLLGISIFGDSYHAGHKPVKRVIIKQALPNIK